MEVDVSCYAGSTAVVCCAVLARTDARVALFAFERVVLSWTAGDTNIVMEISADAGQAMG